MKLFWEPRPPIPPPKSPKPENSNFKQQPQWAFSTHGLVSMPRKNAAAPTWVGGAKRLSDSWTYLRSEGTMVQRRLVGIG